MIEPPGCRHVDLACPVHLGQQLMSKGDANEGGITTLLDDKRWILKAFIGYKMNQI